ncbi:MAG: AIPR family protein [Acholeplasma sp.]|nr:AIPR family protein [Acholeplasma sp.]
MNLKYPEILNELEFYLVEGRNESAAFLMWYLEKYYRLDKQEAIDCVCDNHGDKGVDGIYVNEALGTIEVFQSKISQSDKKTVGDTILKEFYGTLSQFRTKENLQELVDNAGKAEVASLIKRLDLVERLEAYQIKGVFVANTELSSDGEAYLNITEQIEFVGKKQLEDEYISDKKEINVISETTFDISGMEITSYFVDTDTMTYIAPVKATELVKLDGIDDQSIFDYNVRGSLGNTKINKGIVRSIRTKSLHKKFPLFHNGITIVADEVVKTEEKITLKKFYVVNGCQSLTALYKNQFYLTDDLKILTKIVKVPISSSLTPQITEYSNSQNGVKPRDFKSYNQIQIRLQNEINENYSSNYYFEIKRGETIPSGREVISNELSGIYLMSFDLKEPWNTHRKYQVFEDAYNKLFARPEVNAARVVFLHILNKCIGEKMDTIDNKLIARYSLTRYTIMLIVRNILEKDNLGTELIKSPFGFVKDDIKRLKLSEVLSTVIDDIIIDLNGEVNDLGEDFDYKSKLRDDIWVKELSRKIVSNYLKLVKRDRIDSFEVEWEND